MPFPKLHVVLLSFVLASSLWAQSAPDQSSSAPPEGISSSKDTQVDLSPPPGDDASHPDSMQPSDDDVSEMQVWDPHRAMKNVEIGDFYFKNGNYRAAESRYREALKWKSNDAVATFRLAQALEKEEQWSEAKKSYETYLQILPNGEFAQKAREGAQRAASSENKGANTNEAKK